MAPGAQQSLRSQSCGNRRPERFDYPALRDRSTFTGIDHCLQLSAQRREIGDLAIHPPQVLIGDPVDPGAVATAVIGKTEQRAHLIQPRGPRCCCSVCG